MLRQLTLFSLVLILVMLGFAATFSALYGEDTVLIEQYDPETCDISEHPCVWAFGTLGGALLTLFASMVCRTKPITDPAALDWSCFGRC